MGIFGRKPESTENSPATPMIGDADLDDTRRLMIAFTAAVGRDAGMRKGGADTRMSYRQAITLAA